jgi:HEPN domain-containing protein
MTTVDAATSSIEDARESLYEAIQSRERKKYHRAVRRSQEAVELSLKALCWFHNLVPPKSHDIGVFIIRELGATIAPLILEKMATFSRNLEKDRATSFYTSEFISPKEKYRKSDADNAVDEAQFVVDEVSKVLKAMDG